MTTNLPDVPRIVSVVADREDSGEWTIAIDHDDTISPWEALALLRAATLHYEDWLCPWETEDD